MRTAGHLPLHVTGYGEGESQSSFGKRHQFVSCSICNMEDERPDPTLQSLLQDNYRWIFVGGKVVLQHANSDIEPPSPADSLSGPTPDC